MFSRLIFVESRRIGDVPCLFLLLPGIEAFIPRHRSSTDMERSRDRRAEFCPLWRSFRFRAPGFMLRRVGCHQGRACRFGRLRRGGGGPRAPPVSGGRGPTVAPDSVSTGEARSARAFAVARRHSRLVRILRVAFIVGAVGGVVALTGLGLYRTFGGAHGGVL